MSMPEEINRILTDQLSDLFCYVAPRKPLWITWYEGVVGDINFTMACSLTAKKLDIKAAHVEAGLRSRDMTMPGDKPVAHRCNSRSFDSLRAQRSGKPLPFAKKGLKIPGWPQVETLGFVDRSGVLAVITRSMAGLVLLYPVINYLDALPVKMFEYMSAGIPVVASNFPLWKEILGGAEYGICLDPLNPEEIARATRWITINLSEAKRMGETGRRAVEEKYNWDKESEKLPSLYKDLYSLRT
jgi:hypothetical protein